MSPSTIFRALQSVNPSDVRLPLRYCFSLLVEPGIDELDAPDAGGVLEELVSDEGGVLGVVAVEVDDVDGDGLIVDEGDDFDGDGVTTGGVFGDVVDVSRLQPAIPSAIPALSSGTNIKARFMASP